MTDLSQLLDRHFRKVPVLAPGVFIAPTAVLAGDVTIGGHSSVWFGAVLRADLNRISIGRFSNIQDNCVLHITDVLPCVIGDYVTVGHGAIVHGCTIGNEVLIGMGAVILDGAVVEDQCIIGAGAVVTPGTRIPSGSLAVGTPAKVIRSLSQEERTKFKRWAEEYVKLAEAYKRAQSPGHTPITTP